MTHDMNASLPSMTMRKLEFHKWFNEDMGALVSIQNISLYTIVAKASNEEPRDCLCLSCQFRLFGWSHRDVVAVLHSERVPVFQAATHANLPLRIRLQPVR